MLSLHHYFPGGFWPPALLNQPLAQYKATVGDPAVIEEKIKKIAALIDQITAGRKKIQIALDEWSEWDWDYPRPVDTPERSYMNQFIDLLNKSGLEINQTLRDALFNARMLHVFMRQGDRLPIAVRTHMINSLAAIRTDSTRAFVTAPGKMMALYRMHSGTTLLYSEQQSPAYDVPEQGWTSLPYLDSTATLSADGRKLFIHLLNLHPDQNMNVSVQVAGRGVQARGDIWQIAADDFMARNDFGLELVAVQHREAEGLGATFTQSLPPHSATTLELSFQ
jgi:alpha-L-arabinofuranosidase